MLKIYVGAENKPVDCIDDVDLAFNGVKLKDDSFTKDVLQGLEQAELIDAYTFKDRFNRGLYVNCLSTGCKILLESYYYPNRVYSGNEMGYNCIPFLLKMTEGQLYFEQFNYKLPNLPVGFEIMINGIACQSKFEAEEILDEV